MDKQKFYQKTWFIVLALIFFAPLGVFLLFKYKQWKTPVKIIIAVVALLLFLVIWTSNLNSTPPSDNAPANNLESAVVGNPATSTVPAREKAIGESDKNIDDVNKKLVVGNVRNDTTGNWRIATIAESIDITEYALSYYNKYFEDDKEVHAIVNFTYNTTTRISCLGDRLNVTVHEYVKKEEHDAKLLYSGEVLKDYFVYLDNGDIEEVK